MTKDQDGSLLGLDIGSVNLHAALLERNGDLRANVCLPLKGAPLDAIAEALSRLGAPAREPLRVAVTGRGRDLFAQVPGICLENEISACSVAARRLAPSARSIVEIGGHFSKWVQLDSRGDILDYSLNELCAAGSGAFLEQQASRLKVSISKLASLAAAARFGATVAGRCSVFAKSDMIHLQQKGTPLDEIAYGLCLALARNYAATVLKGRELNRPVAVIGGGAANAGLVRALAEVLSISPQDLVLPASFDSFVAIGAGLSAAGRAGGSLTIERLTQEISKIRTQGGAQSAVLPVLVAPPCACQREQEAAEASAGEFFMGVDVGSVSTDFVLLDAEGNVAQGVYLPTRGQPLAVMQEGLSILKEKTQGKARVMSAGTTGSGRHLALHFLGADAARNEITAQMKSTLHYFPDADTIFEIGGQDSKYISVKNGAIHDFAMNKICAAGTGSFLEEQAERLGINIIREFEELALRSRAPADLGSRCTVFMDTELVHALQRGTPANDVAAGLAYSIARNYLDKVVANRPVGANVIFQGGVASNRAVVAALTSLLGAGTKVRVHPYNRLSGAIGAALIARENYLKERKKTRFLGFSGCADYKLKSFECRHCSNMCQVNRLERSGEIAYFGDVCERYTSGTVRHHQLDLKIPDLGIERDRLLTECIAAARPCAPAAQSPGPVEKLLARYAAPTFWTPRAAKTASRRARLKIGIPRASLYFELLPLWGVMFRSLGCEIVLSSPSSPELLAKGSRKLAAETCLPVKLAYSHALDLVSRQVDYIFLPSILDLPSPFGSPEQCSTCPYTQSLPYMIASNVDARFLIPQVNMAMEADGLPEGLDTLTQALGVARGRLRSAYQTGKEAHLAFKETLLRNGAEILNREFDWAAVLIGKPYNLYDSFLNLNLMRHLAKMGVLAIPYEFLPRLADQPLDGSWDCLPWRFNRDYIKAALATRADKRLYPVVVSNFGCGPDGFTLKHLEKIFGGKPSLFLEFDEHRGEAGMVTRLEAFLDEVTAHRTRKTPSAHKPAQPRTKTRPQPRKFYIPYFADHARVYAGVLRYAGFEAQGLPLPDMETRRKGEKFSSGKECHPYLILAGDMVRLTETRPKNDPPAVFLFPGTSIPCLLPQYGPGHRLILDQIGEEGLDVMSPSTQELYDLIGVQGGVRLWRGMVAMDMLVKASCGLRPYERIKGSVDEAHRLNCQDLETTVAGGDIIDTTRKCIERLASVELDAQAWRKRERPVIGVAGDMYTRANAFGNQGLFARLEAMGCEVWPSPFCVDVFEFGLNSAVRTSFYRKDLQKFFHQGSLLLIKELSEQRIKHMFRNQFRSTAEPGYQEVVSVAAPYVGERANAILMLNTSKMVDFAKKGADGIINAVCFNCMLGSVSAAIISRVRRNHGNIPIANLVFGESDGASQDLRLEAFVRQAQDFARRKKTQRLPPPHVTEALAAQTP
ncbi:MAG TPA: hypothetical protein DEB40_12625 [Elusimicrobia bacterium]|nr:hypothetical protein [Elusimicrobiota bacterium]HBT62578.1 hypothetical protein [Elusimicrobiota bacterium]